MSDDPIPHQFVPPTKVLIAFGVCNARSSQTLGDTALRATVIGFSATELRGPGSSGGRVLQEGQAGQVLGHVLDAGINYIGTSIDDGNSEETIGKYLSRRREEFFLASTCGYRVDTTALSNQSSHDFAARNIVAGVHQSLRRMKTDYLDVVQLHRGPRKQTLDQEGTLEALIKLREKGTSDSWDALT